MKTPVQQISETAESLRGKLQDLQGEIAATNNRQLVVERTHTPTMKERIDFLNVLLALEKEEQYVKGQFDCAAMLLRQLT